MKPLMHYMRQLHQRRMHAFFFSPGEDDSSQLSLEHVPRSQDRARSPRELFADQEYDGDDFDVHGFDANGSNVNE